MAVDKGLYPGLVRGCILGWLLQVVHQGSIFIYGQASVPLYFSSSTEPPNPEHSPPPQGPEDARGAAGSECTWDNWFTARPASSGASPPPPLAAQGSASLTTTLARGQCHFSYFIITEFNFVLGSPNSIILGLKLSLCKS